MTEVAEKVKEEKVFIQGKVSVRPYVNPTAENMGLEKHNMVLHQGASHKEYLTSLEVHGVRRHLTGLDEFAPEVDKLTDSARKKAVIKQIRTKVSFLEKMLASNSLDAHIDERNPKDFWDKVTIIKRENLKFWDDIYVEVTNEPLFLDPKDPKDLILICAIEARGFSEVAPSYEDARSGSLAYKFYLDKEVETSKARTDFKKVKNEALSFLAELDNKDKKKLWWIAKNIDANSAQYKKNTSTDVIYDNMDNYINGQSIERSVTKASENFIRHAGMEIEHLRVRGTVRDAVFFSYVLPKPDGNMYHNHSSTLMGKNISDCVEYLKNPGNAKMWETILAEVETHINE